MPVFKTTDEILKHPWRDNTATKSLNLRKPGNWHYKQDLTIDDVVLWEEIYYQPGNIGVYAAWSPYAEYYMITYNLFLNTDYGIETFYGNNACKQVWELVKTFGIDLPVNKVWAEKEDLWLYTETPTE